MHVWECEWSDEGWGWFLGLEKRCLSPMLNLPYAFPRSEVFTLNPPPPTHPPVSLFVEMHPNEYRKCLLKFIFKIQIFFTH